MAEKKVPVQVVISAVDNLSYKVIAMNDKIAKKFEKISGPAKKLGAALGTLGGELGLGKAGKALGEIGKAGKEMFSQVSEAALKVGGVVLAAGGALYGLVHSFSDAGDRINDTAKRLGLTTDAFQELSFAAEQSGVDQETFTAAMGKFSKGIAETAAGTGEAFIGMNALGISVRDSTGHIRKMDDLLPEVADKLGAIKNQSLRNAIAAKIFGKEGAKLNGMFEEGSAGLAKLRAEAHRVGAVMTPEQIKAAADFDDGMKSVFATLTSVRNIVGASLAPVFLKLGQTLQTYILDHTEEIKAFAAQFAGNLPGYIQQLIGFVQGFGGVLNTLISIFGALSAVFGPVNTALGLLFFYFGGGGMIMSVISFVKSLGGLVSVLQSAWGILTLVGGVLLDITVALAAIVGWPVLIGAAFVTAALLVWKYWEPIKKFFSNTWDKLAGIFGGTTTINGNLTTSAGVAAPTFGPPMNAMNTVDANARAKDPTLGDKQSKVLIEFANAPEGAKLVQKKSSPNLDLIYSGMAGAMN